MSKIFDISPPISEKSAVWPGDINFRRQIQATLEAGDTIDLSSIETTVHIGAHADAPSHYHQKGCSIDSVELDSYIGPCKLVRISTPTITEEACQEAFESGVERMLFCTESDEKKETNFSEAFSYFEPEALDYLGEKGVKLVGIDTPSVDPFSSKDLAAHQMLFKWGMRNLEGLRLFHVPTGHYELIALPLRIVGADASPVRAVLRESL